MSMNFLDETDDWPEYQFVRDEINRLESELLELKRALDTAESAYQKDPSNNDLKGEVNRLKERLKKTEQKLDESTSMYR